MGISYSCSDKQIASLAAGAVLLLCLSLGSCANSNSSVMNARAEAPTSANKYMPLEDLPPTREKPAMTVDEQSKLRKELIDARDRQAAAVRARDNTRSN
jgi:hypothetical protein